MVQREAGSETTTCTTVHVCCIHSCINLQRGGVRCGVVARAQATGCTVYIHMLHRLYW